MLIAACLTGCGSYTIFDDATSSFTSAGKSDWARNLQRDSASGPESGSGNSQNTSSNAPSAQPSAATEKANSEALNSLFSRATADQPPPVPAASVPATPPSKPVKLADVADTKSPAEAAPRAADKIVLQPHGRAYLFRGIAGLIYSRGMDHLAERISRAGVPASVDTYLVWRGVADQAIRDYRRDPAPIILIGHSMGGDAALAFADELNGLGIPVSLVVTYDPSRIAESVPPNVERYINIFQSHNIMGGGNVVEGQRFHGHYASYNLKDHSELIHINIEKADRIQEQLVEKVVDLAATPAGTSGESVPLRLEVPADAAIELWDSGVPVAAHAGDTLKTIAANYHVPLWPLTQINQVSQRTPLDEGQRIIVPRRLVPMTTPSAVTSYAPTER